MYHLKHQSHGNVVDAVSLDELILFINSKQYQYPKPDIEKMKSELSQRNIFIYAVQTLKVTFN